MYLCVVHIKFGKISVKVTLFYFKSYLLQMLEILPTSVIFLQVSQYLTTVLLAGRTIQEFNN